MPIGQMCRKIIRPQDGQHAMWLVPQGGSRAYLAIQPLGRAVIALWLWRVADQAPGAVPDAVAATPAS